MPRQRRREAEEASRQAADRRRRQNICEMSDSHLSKVPRCSSMHPTAKRVAEKGITVRYEVGSSFTVRRARCPSHRSISMSRRWHQLCSAQLCFGDLGQRAERAWREGTCQICHQHLSISQQTPPHQRQRRRPSKARPFAPAARAPAYAATACQIQSWQCLDSLKKIRLPPVNFPLAHSQTPSGNRLRYLHQYAEFNRSCYQSFRLCQQVLVVCYHKCRRNKSPRSTAMPPFLPFNHFIAHTSHRSKPQSSSNNRQLHSLLSPSTCTFAPSPWLQLQPLLALRAAGASRQVCGGFHASMLLLPTPCQPITGSAGLGQTTWHFPNTTSFFPTASLYETVYTTTTTAQHKVAIDNTLYHELSITNSGHLLVQTEAQETTVDPKVYTTHTSSISEHHEGASTSADDTVRYINQVHSALGSLVFMLVPNRTTSSDVITANATRVPQLNDSPTSFSSATPTTKATSPASAPVNQPSHRLPQIDLIFLNATSPCYIALDRLNKSFIMIWQAPISERSTPADPKALDDAKKAKNWTTIFYYWAKVVSLTVLGIFALYQASRTIIAMCEPLCAWLARRRAL